MHDCYAVKEDDIDFSDDCALNLKENPGAASEERYLYDIETGDKFVPGVDQPPTECTSASSNNTEEFEAANSREEVVSWLQFIADTNRDPFWAVPPSEEPLDPQDPRVDVSLFNLKGRTRFDGEPMEIRNRRKTLFKGKLEDGRLHGKVGEDSAEDPDWFAPLQIQFTNGQLSKSIASGFSVVNNGKPDSGIAAVYGKLRHGRLHGPVRMFGQYSNDPKSSCAGKQLNAGALSFVGHFSHGVPTGYCWKGLLGGAWIHGKVNPEDGEFTGEDIAYVYPDFKIALVGKFEKGIMVRCVKTWARFFLNVQLQ